SLLESKCGKKNAVSFRFFRGATLLRSGPPGPSCPGAVLGACSPATSWRRACPSASSRPAPSRLNLASPSAAFCARPSAGGAAPGHGRRPAPAGEAVCPAGPSVGKLIAPEVTGDVLRQVPVRPRRRLVVAGPAAAQVLQLRLHVLELLRQVRVILPEHL